LCLTIKTENEEQTIYYAHNGWRSKKTEGVFIQIPFKFIDTIVSENKKLLIDSNRSKVNFKCHNADLQLYIRLHVMLALQKIGPVTVTVFFACSHHGAPGVTS
jgi:hypothetical protein